MTANNLAGGLAGGASGVEPLPSLAACFAASFLLMLIGNLLGRAVVTRLPLDPHGCAAAVFGALSVSQLAGPVVLGPTLGAALIFCCAAYLSKCVVRHVVSRRARQVGVPCDLHVAVTPASCGLEATG